MEKKHRTTFRENRNKFRDQISDPQMNRYVLGTGQSAILCGVAAKVYVDAVTGAVLENRFVTEKSIS